MDETPEQILARLERHADAVRRASKPVSAAAAQQRQARQEPPRGTAAGLPSKSLLRGAVPARPGPAPYPAASPGAAAAAPATLVVHWGGERAADLIPEDAAREPRFGLMLRTVTGQVLAVLSCVLALLATMALSAALTTAVIGAVTVACLVGTLRKVPLTGWCALGLVIGWTLGRFS